MPGICWLALGSGTYQSTSSADHLPRMSLSLSLPMPLSLPLCLHLYLSVPISVPCLRLCLYLPIPSSISGSLSISVSLSQILSLCPSLCLHLCYLGIYSVLRPDCTTYLSSCNLFWAIVYRHITNYHIRM